MTLRNWTRVDRLLQQALERSPAERTAFLDEACAGDAQLRRELDSLLAADAEAGSFLEKPFADNFTDALTSAQAAAGQRIGAYQLVREIGRGGMGAVYLAERADKQFEKQVALKLIKRGMDTEEIIRRFRYERQILARLDHPNIARLLDGGTTADGLPYFVMEYIEGQPLTEYCDAQQLSTTERLKLFLAVCAAVQYAHQHLVIHRDLKPGNILVTKAGEVKLLDFGIAKLLDPESASSTIAELRPMTPEYASPEQARGESVTTTSDVYSLGVVLYELLTGRRPYRFAARTKEEVARVLCEQEPLKPSLAVRQNQPSNDEAQNSSVRDQSQSAVRTPRSASNLPQALRNLKGDLDNIVLMALRKDPQRRYVTVGQLAADIRRHLDGMPVVAAHNSLTYRAGKFIRRHKAGVMAAVLVTLTLVGGIIATTWQARVARAERARAEQRFNDVRKLANSFMFEFHDAIQNLPGTVPARQLVVTKALEYLDSLAREGSNDPALQRELATAYQKLGEIQGAIINETNSGNSAGALTSYRKALSIREALSAASPEDIALRSDLAASYLRLSQVMAETGDASGALELCLKGVASREAIVTTDPTNPQYRFDLASSYRSLFSMQAFNGHYLAGVESLGKALDLLETLWAADPANAQIRRQLVISHQQFGDQMWLLGEPTKAWEHYRRGRHLSEEWTRQEPANQEARRLLLASYVFSSDMQSRYGNPAEALRELRRGMVWAEEAVARNPGDTRSPRDLALAYEKTGQVFAGKGETAQALEYYRKSIAIHEKLAAADPQSTRFHRDLGEAYTMLGNTLAVRNETAQALEAARKAVSLFETLLAKDPNHVEIRRNAAFAFFLLAQLLHRSGQDTEARRYLSHTLEIQKAQADKAETVGDRINDYPRTLLTCEPEDLRDPAAALPYAQLAAERTHENDPNILKTLALAYHLNGNDSRAVETVRKALSLLPEQKSVLRRELEAQLAKSEAALRQSSEKRWQQPFLKAGGQRKPDASLQPLLPPAFVCRLPDTDPDCVGDFAVHFEDDINLAAPDERARQAHIDLIKSDKAALIARVKHFRICPANRADSRRKAAPPANACAVKNQEELIIRQPEIKRNRDKFLLR
jgi:non-specific serine/threonine protein kinase/serine/threonine-protein kinase